MGKRGESGGGERVESSEAPSASPSPTPSPLEQSTGRACPAHSVSATVSLPFPPLGTQTLTLEGHRLRGEQEGVVVAVQAFLPDHGHDGT